jgi:uncharacterized protein YdcH (DUF465 family)
MSEFDARDRFDRLLEQANEQDTTIDERAEQLDETIRTLQDGDETFEVLSDYE